MKKKKYFVLGIFYIIISSMCFGTLGLFNDIGEKAGLTISERVFYRFIISLFIVFIIIVKQKKTIKIKSSSLIKLSFGSVFYFSLTSLFLYISYDFIGIGFSTVLHFTYPILVLILAVTINKEKPHKLQIVGTFIALIGLIFIIGPSLKGNVLGIIFALASAISFTFYVRMIEKDYCRELDILVLLFYIFLASSIVWIGPAFISNINNPRILNYSFAAISLIGSAIIGTVFSLLFFAKGLMQIGGRMASILSVLEPVTSVILGIFLLNESLSKYFFGGLIFLFLGIILVSSFEKQIYD